MYGQPYAAGPQMVYSPSGAAYAYGPAPVMAAWPYAIPAANYQDGQPIVEPSPDPDTSAEYVESDDDSGSEYFLEDGGRHGHGGGHLASLLSWLAPYSEAGCCAPHWFDVHAEAVFLRRDDDAPYLGLHPAGPAR